MYYLQLVQLESWVYLYHSWFSLDGLTDFGVVTLACDDDKRIQAHEVYLATGSVGSSFSSTTGFSWTLRYIWPLLQAPSPLVPQALVSTAIFSWNLWPYVMLVVL